MIPSLTKMKTNVFSVAALAALTLSAVAAPQSFDFKDPKGVNNAAFKLDAPLEAISGSANGITGKILFDPEKPADTRGKIVIASSSITVPNAMMNSHLHGEKWIHAAKYPELSFEVKALRNLKTSGDVTTGEAVGSFTCKDVSKELIIPVKMSYLKDKLGNRVPNMKGDLLVIRSNFTIKRSEFNINPGQAEDKVSDEIELALSIAGAAAR